MATSTSDPSYSQNSHTDPSLRDIPLTFQNLARIPVLALIRIYQKTLSRTLPANTCRFYPTCSRYGYLSIYKFGLLRGGLMAAWRVLRCNPFNPGGLDPVPDEIANLSNVWEKIKQKYLTNPR